MDHLTERNSIAALLQQQASAMPEATAIASPGRESLSWGALFEHVSRTVARLNDMGVGRNDRVAVVLPNGPEMAVTFLSVASGATCAPLNPAYKAEEFDFYLSDLRAAVLIVEAGSTSPVRTVAEAMGIRTVQLEPDTGVSGLFDLCGPPVSPSAAAGFAGPADVALVLHTSGTTSRPKIVPLSGGNLCTNAENIRVSLELTTADRCLNVMPLFHIHGLVGATLSTVAAGGSIYCTPGFVAPEFHAWLQDSSATWYTAVPTMHQAVLARTAANRDSITNRSLRFIRSSSAPLPVPVIAELEAVFGVPVVEAYGMTEAAHQIACNPLPPGIRRPGSVGIATGPEVSIMNEAGTLVEPGAIGEIVIRGPNVTEGYENNPDANASAFAAGWFRTGDQGYLDDDGYLFITGRIKELINRGGEKIAPREVDDVLLEHPDVAQAVTFAVPHPTLGEDVAAAVVMREESALTSLQLRSFAADRLAYFKVPHHIAFVAELPKGSTGKVQRIGLAERLGLAVADPGAGEAIYVAPRTDTEAELAAIWAEVLAVDRVGAEDDFFQLGGDSMLALRIGARVQDRLGVEVPLPVLFDTPTLAAVAAVIEQARESAGAERSQAGSSD